MFERAKVSGPYQAGQNQTTGNDNIYVSNVGVAGESGTIKIGTTGTHTSAHIMGIRDVTPAGATETVVIDASGQLGSVAGDVGTNATAIGVNAADIDTLEALNLGTLAGDVAQNTTDQYWPVVAG